jgi:hypothetical protein
VIDRNKTGAELALLEREFSGETEQPGKTRSRLDDGTAQPGVPGPLPNVDLVE